MSTHISVSCGFCYANASLGKCDKCCQKICANCLDIHDSIVCELIQKHVPVVTYFCKVHRRCKVVSFCTVCYQILCDDCKKDHDTHKREVHNLIDSFSVVQDNFTQLSKEFKLKQSEADLYIDEFPALCEQIDKVQEHFGKIKHITIPSSFDKYKAYIKDKHDKMVKFRAVLEHSIDSLSRLNSISNPYTFLPLLGDIVSEIRKLEKEINTEKEEGSDIGEISDFIRKTSISIGIQSQRDSTVTTQQDETTICHGEQQRTPIRDHVDQLADAMSQSLKIKEEELQSRNVKRTEDEHFDLQEENRKLNSIINEKLDDLRKIQKEESDIFASANRLCTNIIQFSTREFHPREIFDAQSFTEMTEFVFDFCKETNNELKNLREQLAKTESMRSEFKVELEAKIEAYKESQREEINKLNSQKVAYQNENKILEGQINSLEKSKLRLETKVKEKSASDLNGKVEEIRRLEEKIKQLEKELEDRQNTVKCLSSQLEQSKPKSQGTAKREDERQHYENRIKQLEKELEDQKNTVQNMTKQLEKSKISARNLDGKVEEMTHLEEKIKQLEKELEDRQNTVESLSSQLKQSKPNASDLNGKVEETTRLEEKIKQLDKELEDRQNTVESLSSQLKQSKPKQQGTVKMIDDTQLYENSMKQLEKELEGQKNTVQNMTKQLEKSKVSASDLNKREDEIHRLEEKITQLEKELEDRQNTVESLSSQLEQSKTKANNILQQSNNRTKLCEQTIIELNMKYSQLQKNTVDEVKSLQSSIDKLEIEKKKIIEEYTKQEKRAKTFEDLYQSKERVIRQLHHEYQDQKHRTDILSGQLHESELRVKKAQKDMEQYVSDIKDRDKWINDTLTIYQPMWAENEKTKKTLAETQQKILDYIDDHQKKSLTMKQLKKSCDEVIKKSQERESEMERQLHLAQSDFNQRTAENDKVIKSLKEEKDDLQTRLSSVAGDKLTRGNPSITDLADPNRPMKIGEKYGELYDNDWTDAMEKVDIIKKHLPGRKTSEAEEIMIKYLHRIVRGCYEECLRKASGQVNQIAKIMGMDPNEATSGTEMNNLHGLIACRIRNAESFANHLALEKAFCDALLDEWEYPFKNEEVMKELISFPFFKRCVELCWYMVIQDPVMCIDEEIPQGTPIDRNTYKEFTKSGEKVVYVVWPALYLHKDGPVLYKGVAQVV